MFDQLINGKDYRIIGELVNTEKVMNSGFWVGLYPGMKNGSIEFMVEKIREFVLTHVNE
jgi:CDP-6-deoxy-D-xylo-4-hexulose-3-dehydrase